MQANNEPGYHPAATREDKEDGSLTSEQRRQMLIDVGLRILSWPGIAVVLLVGLALLSPNGQAQFVSLRFAFQFVLLFLFVGILINAFEIWDIFRGHILQCEGTYSHVTRIMGTGNGMHRSTRLFIGSQKVRLPVTMWFKRSLDEGEKYQAYYLRRSKVIVSYLHVENPTQTSSS